MGFFSWAISFLGPFELGCTFVRQHSEYRKNLGVTPGYNHIPEYGLRVDYEIPVTMHCLRCQDNEKGGGVCGFDTESQNFLCLCKKENVTTYCADQNFQHNRPGVVAGTVTAVSVAGAFGIGAGVWYLRRLRAKVPVTHGVQSNENRLF